jgi:hypothetical protein
LRKSLFQHAMSLLKSRGLLAAAVLARIVKPIYGQTR